MILGFLWGSTEVERPVFRLVHTRGDENGGEMIPVFYFLVHLTPNKAILLSRSDLQPAARPRTPPPLLPSASRSALDALDGALGP